MRAIQVPAGPIRLYPAHRIPTPGDRRAGRDAQAMRCDREGVPQVPKSRHAQLLHAGARRVGGTGAPHSSAVQTERAQPVILRVCVQCKIGNRIRETTSINYPLSFLENPILQFD